MITTTLRDQLQYLERTSNPNYIVIIKNKAGENMDFSKFEAILPKNKEVYKPKLRYEIVVIKSIVERPMDLEPRSLILVKDTYVNNRVVFECRCKDSKLEDRLLEVNSKYKGRSILDKVCL